MKRGCDTKAEVFDGGTIIGVLVYPEKEGGKRFAFKLSVGGAEMLIDNLRDALKLAEHRRR